MAVGAKAIRNRIRSIKNTSKITKAMELVSANKMRKASRMAVGGRAYDLSLSEIIKAIARDRSLKGQFFYNEGEERKEIKNVLIILFSGNRGLCGSFNSSIINFAKRAIKEKMASAEIGRAWIAIGKKGLEDLARSGEKIDAEFKKIESGEASEDFWTVGKFVTQEFVSGKFDEVWIAYTDFVSPLKQIPRLNRLLPIKRDASDTDEMEAEEIYFEPGKEQLLSYLVPRLIETKLYQALLESNASEHSSRMVAMKNASDACRDITDELVFESNELRQAGITREIIEIAGAKSALG